MNAQSQEALPKSPKMPSKEVPWILRATKEVPARPQTPISKQHAKL